MNVYNHSSHSGFQNKNDKYSHAPAITSDKANLTFQGYGAVPLKGLILQPKLDESFTIAQVLNKIGKEEKFSVYIQFPKGLINVENLIPGRHNIDPKTCFWAQDLLAIRQTARGEVVDYPSGWEDIGEGLASQLQMDSNPLTDQIAGGNYFLGWNKDGSKYLIIGKNELKQFLNIPTLNESSRKNWINIAKTLASQTMDVPEQNIMMLPQPNFHVDMMIRPLAGNKILVQDFHETYKMLAHFLDNATRDQEWELYGLVRQTFRYEQYLKREGYAPMSVITKKLEKNFNVIKVPGLVSNNGKTTVANYMNAIVHQRDGKLAYITNKSDFPKFDDYFERYLRTLCPEVTSFYTVGSNGENSTMSSYLEEEQGGIHCIVNEWPDFQAVHKLYAYA